MHNVQELLKQITTKLTPHIPRASREAQLFLMHHMGVDELWLLTNQNSPVSNIDQLFEMVQRRCNNEPFEYITNRVSFYSEVFHIEEGALIPRPETELLIDEVLKHYPNIDARLQFAEVGVGSAVISIMLAKKYTNAKFIAVDISKDALKVAKKNIEKFHLQERIELKEGSLLDPVDIDVDYVVSNPPYIKNGVALESNLDYEPQNALFGGEVGDEIIKELLDEVLKRDIKFFSCEMGYDQKGRISDYVKQKEYKTLDFYKDYAGFDRGFTLEL